eukprot:COSAG02_NODE_19986_length_854_cov_0.810596_2_plen_174_part_00
MHRRTLMGEWSVSMCASQGGSARTSSRTSLSDYPDHMCLNDLECQSLGADFTGKEVLTAIKGLSVNKSTHGVVAEVFKGAAAELAPLLTAQLNYARQVGSLAPRQRQGRIALLFKKGSRLLASQYRPVAVLACDFKIAALIMTARMTPHLACVTKETQTGFVTGRYIHENCLR